MKCFLYLLILRFTYSRFFPEPLAVSIVTEVRSVSVKVEESRGISWGWTGRPHWGPPAPHRGGFPNIQPESSEWFYTGSVLTGKREYRQMKQIPNWCSRQDHNPAIFVTMHQYSKADLLMFFCYQTQLSTVNLLKDTPCSRLLCLAKCVSFSECICEIGESGKWVGDVYLKIRHASAFVALGKVTSYHCCLKFMWWVPLLSAFVWLEKVFEGLERCLSHVEKVQKTTRIGSSRRSPFWSLLGLRSVI